MHLRSTATVSPIQIAAFFLLVPCVVAFIKVRLFLTWILLVNLALCVLVNRPNAHSSVLVDVFSATIAMWCVAVLLVILERPFHPNSYFSIVCAIFAMLCAMLRVRYGGKQSVERVTSFAMLCFGIIATTVIIL